MFYIERTREDGKIYWWNGECWDRVRAKGYKYKGTAMNMAKEISAKGLHYGDKIDVKNSLA